MGKAIFGVSYNSLINIDMFQEDIFAAALGITSPWYIESINFDDNNSRLDVRVNFKVGSKFDYIDTEGKHYDAVVSASLKSSTF